MTVFNDRKHDCVAIVSGGLDSTTLVYDLITSGYKPHMLSFDYGQRHYKELTFAKATAKQFNLRHDIVDLQGLTHLISNSALTSRQDFPSRNPGTGEPWTREQFANLSKSHPDPIDVPEGHYAEDNMKATVVPNRNMIMIAIAAGVAVNYKYRTVATGVHGGDHFIYPDCRPNFIFSLGQAILQGNEGFHNFIIDNEPREVGGLTYRGTALPIYAPYMDSTKADIAYRALELGVPLHLTWSCYKGEDKHCGKCGTCVERLEAIDEAINRFETEGKLQYKGENVRPVDNTEYEDTEFWRTAVKQS